MRKEILKTFLDLVKIDSPSGEEKGVADYVLFRFKEAGIKAEKDGYGNVKAFLKGKGKPLLLAAHMDTVEPGRSIKPVIKKDLIISDGRTILGADNKAALAVILETVIKTVREKKAGRPLEIIFTCREEVDFKGARNLNYKKIMSRHGLVLDAPGRTGRIILRSPYIYNLGIKIKGRAAHAGAEPEKGISAIKIAADAIGSFKSGRISSTVTTNLGVMRAGSAVDTVPEEAVIKAEVRGFKRREAEAQVDIMNRAFKKAVRRAGGRLSFESKLVGRGYELNAQDEFVKNVAKAMRRAGAEVAYGRSGVATDANIFAARGIKMLNLSYGSLNNHTRRESQRISDLVIVGEILMNVISLN